MAWDEGFLLIIALVLGALAFRLSSTMGWHWALGLFLALLPFAASLLLGIIGLLGSAVFVGALYRASA